jgi:hypothetical protein
MDDLDADFIRASNVLSVMLSKIPRPAISSASLKPHQINGVQPQSNGVPSAISPPSFADLTWESGATALMNDDFGTENNAAFDFSSALFTESDQIDWVSFFSSAFLDPSLI